MTPYRFRLLVGLARIVDGLTFIVGLDTRFSMEAALRLARWRMRRRDDEAARVRRR